MPLPDRPVANADIETLWGQEVHDWTFAPKGAHLTTATPRTVTSTSLHVNLDVAVDDPAGFLDAANDQAVWPAGSDGLYLHILRLDSVDGDVGTETRAWIYLNGSPYAHQTEDNNGGTHIIVTVAALIPMTAGDIIQIFGQRKGSGTNPSVYPKSYQFLRVGEGYGA